MLLPQIPPEQILGCRTPPLRALAKSLGTDAPEVQAFLQTLPHSYFDENQLHAFLVAREKGFARCAARVDAFLPFVDNWATCDQLSPAVFKKHREELLPWIEQWLAKAHPFAVRFGVGMLMRYYLDDAFDPRYPEMVAAIRSTEYYVNMMIAWYFATALAKRWDETLPYLEPGRLEPWTRAKAIQKALESDRVPPERKAVLKALR